MANHKGPVPSWLTMPYLEKVLSDSLKLPELMLKAMDISPGSKEGDNYACQIFRIATVYVSNGEEHKLSLIGKCMVHTKVMEMIDVGERFFEVEAKYYETLAPKIREITGIEDSIGPKLYYVDRENKIMFLQDLVVRGFKLQDRRCLLNLEQCNLTIDALATLHGCSYQMLQENPEWKNIFKKYFWGAERTEAVVKWCESVGAATRTHIDKYGLSEKLSKKLLGVFDRLQNEFFQVCELEEGKLNFLLHGDSWKSNMMYRFNGNNSEAVKLVDFQIVNYNCFANDLLYFLFSSVDVQVIIENLENILKRYYDKLISIEPNVPGLTYDRIKKEFEERYFFGLCMAILFRGIFYSEKPLDADDELAGKEHGKGYYDDPRYIEEIKLIMMFFDKTGAI